MRGFYIGIFAALVSFPLMACWIQVRNGVADTCEGTPSYDHNEFDDTCTAMCMNCGNLAMSEPNADGSNHHLPLCPKNPAVCPVVGTDHCSGSEFDVSYSHVNGGESLPCEASCKICKKSKVNSSSHHPGCLYFYQPPDDGDDGESDDGGGGDGGDDGGDDGAGSDIIIGDVDTPSLPIVPSVTPDQLTFPENPALNFDPSFDGSVLPAFNIGAFDFLKNRFGTRAPRLNVDLGILSGGYSCQTFVIDFAENEALSTAVSYIRAFELVCLFLAALFFMWKIIRSLEL